MLGSFHLVPASCLSVRVQSLSEAKMPRSLAQLWYGRGWGHRHMWETQAEVPPHLGPALLFPLRQCPVASVWDPRLLCVELLCSPWRKFLGIIHLVWGPPGSTQRPLWGPRMEPRLLYAITPVQSPQPILGHWGLSDPKPQVGASPPPGRKGSAIVAPRGGRKQQPQQSSQWPGILPPGRGRPHTEDRAPQPPPAVSS